MAASKTVVANLALGHVGSSVEIANLDTENSREAKSCRRYFDQVREEMLSGFGWPFATEFKTLTLIEANPTTEWAFSYRYPVEALYVRRIVSDTRNDSRQSRVAYKFGQDASGQIIYTDMETAIVEYTTTSSDVSKWPPDFVNAFAWKLAMYIAPTLTAGDPYKLSERCMQMHNLALLDAQASALNEEQVDEEVESEAIRSREGSTLGAFKDVGPKRS